MGNVYRRRPQVFMCAKVAVLPGRPSQSNQTAFARSSAGAVGDREELDEHSAHQGHNGRADTATGGDEGEKAQWAVGAFK